MSDSTYAPQSPDLSSFFSTSPPKSQQQQQPAQTSSYAPRSPNLALLGQSSSYTPQSPQQQDFTGGYQPPSHFLGGHSQRQQFGAGEGLGFADYTSGSGQGGGHLPPIPDLPSSHVESLQPPPPTHQNPYAYQVPQQHSPAQSFSSSPTFKREDIDYTQPDSPLRSQPFALSQPPHPRFQDSGAGSAAAGSEMASRSKRTAVKDENGAGPSMGIEVKTKFPVARIKRIMQADEEVGKVAQVTPVAVSKALELFMISLVTKSAALARAGSSKRVTAQHLKRAIEADEQFDFLGEIVAKVADGPDAGGKRVKDEADSSADEASGKVVKKKRGGGRKKVE